MFAITKQEAALLRMAVLNHMSSGSSPVLTGAAIAASPHHSFAKLLCQPSDPESNRILHVMRGKHDHIMVTQPYMGKTIIRAFRDAGGIVVENSDSTLIVRPPHRGGGAVVLRREYVHNGELLPAVEMYLRLTFDIEGKYHLTAANMNSLGFWYDQDGRLKPDFWRLGLPETVAGLGAQVEQAVRVASVLLNCGNAISEAAVLQKHDQNQRCEWAGKGHPEVKVADMRQKRLGKPAENKASKMAFRVGGVKADTYTKFLQPIRDLLRDGGGKNEIVDHHGCGQSSLSGSGKALLVSASKAVVNSIDPNIQVNCKHDYRLTSEEYLAQNPPGTVLVSDVAYKDEALHCSGSEHTLRVLEKIVPLYGRGVVKLVLGDVEENLRYAELFRDCELFPYPKMVLTNMELIVRYERRNNSFEHAAFFQSVVAFVEECNLMRMTFFESGKSPGLLFRCAQLDLPTINFNGWVDDMLGKMFLTPIRRKMQFNTTYGVAATISMGSLMDEIHKALVKGRKDLANFEAAKRRFMSLQHGEGVLRHLQRRVNDILSDQGALTPDEKIDRVIDRLSCSYPEWVIDLRKYIDCVVRFVGK